MLLNEIMFVLLVAGESNRFPEYQETPVTTMGFTHRPARKNAGTIIRRIPPFEGCKFVSRKAYFYRCSGLHAASFIVRFTRSTCARARLRSAKLHEFIRWSRLS